MILRWGGLQTELFRGYHRIGIDCVGPDALLALAGRGRMPVFRSVDLNDLRDAVAKALAGTRIDR